MKTSRLSPRILISTDLPIELLTNSPLCINSLRTLSYADEHDGIELTKLAYFKRVFVAWAVVEFKWPRYEAELLYSVNKVLNEPDFPPLLTVHDILLRTRYMRHYKGRAVTTKLGRHVLANPCELQAEMFDQIFLDDGPYGLEPGIIETGLADLTSVIAFVGQMDEWLPVSEFALQCVSVDDFPAAGPLGPQYEAALYVVTSIIRPLNWLGLIEVESQEAMRTNVAGARIRKTALFGAFVRVITHTSVSDLRQ